MILADLPEGVSGCCTTFGYVFLGVPIIGVIWGFYRSTRPVKRPDFSHCAKCGYDIRATPDCCPECGTVPPGGNVHH